MVYIFTFTTLQVTIMDENTGFVSMGRRKLEVSSRTCQAEPGTTPPANAALFSYYAAVSSICWEKGVFICFLAEK
jgi:hypothetical protein